jgi:hypothetical protein
VQVWGPNYLSDKRKVEAEVLEAELLSVDLVDVAPTFHIARHLPSALHCTAPFMFIMQVLLPALCDPKQLLITCCTAPRPSCSSCRCHRCCAAEPRQAFGNYWLV